LDTVKEEVDKLMDDDVIVFWGGANNVSKNNSTKVLTQTIDFVRRNQQTSVIIIPVPHRFDLDDSSCIKKEIRAYNRKLNKVANHFNRLTLVKATSERNLFTRHGLHVNVRGKEVMSKKLAVIIHEIVDECNKNDAIPMIWKDDSLKYSDQGRETDVLNVIDKGVDQVSNERNFENVTMVVI
jgi:lysophospholipase L1-like esterase